MVTIYNNICIYKSAKQNKSLQFIYIDLYISSLKSIFYLNVSRKLRLSSILNVDIEKYNIHVIGRY